MIRKLYTFLAVAAFTLSGCNKGTQDKPKADSHDIKTIPTEITDNGDQAVKNTNKRDAGFISNRVNEVTLTIPCLGVVNMDNLDLLPPPNEISKKDSTIIKQLNNGEVFLLQPETKGIMLTDAGSKLLVRFQMGELWVWKSATK
jgi:putative lipoprotein